MNVYRWSNPLTLFNIIVRRMNGRAAFIAPKGLSVLPHIMPNEAKRKPDSPIVGSVTYVGR